MVNRKKILFICGSLNQTTMMHKISKCLPDYDSYFTPFYADGFIDKMVQKKILDFTILGGAFRENTEKYLKENNCCIDYQGIDNDYDLALTCSDLIVPKNVRNRKLILVQEGMTDPRNIAYYLVKWLKMPRYIASTSTTGMSNAFDFFCVASEGYKNLFKENNVVESKIRVTGIPNFDNCLEYYNNDFPYHRFVMVATSDARETMKFENRRKFILDCVKIADGRQLIFKLHPNENFQRAIKEIYKWAPKAIVFKDGNAHEMIANCDVLITKYSTVAYTGIALGKEVYSYFDIEQLRQLAPLQNNGTSASNIADVCRELLEKKGHKRTQKKISIKKLFRFQPMKLRKNNKKSTTV